MRKTFYNKESAKTLEKDIKIKIINNLYEILFQNQSKDLLFWKTIQSIYR